MLAAAPRRVRFLGPTGLNVRTRIMGLPVAAAAVQFIADGARPVLVGNLRAAGVGS